MRGIRLRAGLGKFCKVINDHQDTKVARFSFRKFQVVYLDKFIGCPALQRSQRELHPLLGQLAGLAYEAAIDISCHVLGQCWSIELLQDQVSSFRFPDTGLLMMRQVESFHLEQLRQIDYIADHGWRFSQDSGSHHIQVGLVSGVV